jgi:ribose 5-phosphate isomerase B
MKILFASDHAGFDLRKKLIAFVSGLGYEVEDCGAVTYDENDDYPDIIAPVARKISENPEQLRAVILGGSGQGEAIVANRFPKVRAVVYNGESKGSLFNNLDEIALSREHNDANILSLGARFLTEKEACDTVNRWLTTPFSGAPHHKRRIARIEEVCA